MKALNITCQAIDYLLNVENETPSLIACELPFLGGKRKADIVAIINGELIAFEIKSKADNLSKLQEQSLDYQQTFQRVFVIVDAEHLKNTREMIDSRVGIIQSKSSSLLPIRQAHRRIRLNKKHLCKIFTKKFLEKTLGESSRSYNDLTELRERLRTKLSTPQLLELVKGYLLEKYGHRYKRFLTEKGKVTHTDDLLLLSRDITSKLN